MYKVYLLQSKKDGTYYIGQTDNIENRLNRHNSGKVRSTKNKVPWELIKFETYKSRDEARWREYNLKRNSNLRKKFYGV